MNTYGKIFKLRFYHSLQYRVAALAGIATQFFWGLITLMVFMAFYGAKETVGGFSKGQLATYLWLQQAFLVFVMLWIRDNELFESIRSGNIAYTLCRPISIYRFWYVRLLADRVSKGVLRSLPILVIASFLNAPYALKGAYSVGHLAAFVVAMGLGLLITVAISMYVYISVFVTLSPMGSLLIFGTIGEFFSGLILPIPLMPEGLQNFLYFLPFRYMADFPFRVYSGHLTMDEALVGICLQCFWLMLLWTSGEWLMRRAMKRLVVQGG